MVDAPILSPSTYGQLSLTGPSTVVSAPRAKRTSEAGAPGRVRSWRSTRPVAASAEHSFVAALAIARVVAEPAMGFVANRNARVWARGRREASGRARMNRGRRGVPRPQIGDNDGVYPTPRALADLRVHCCSASDARHRESCRGRWQHLGSPVESAKSAASAAAACHDLIVWTKALLLDAHAPG